jgi:hypothetical protein
MQLMAVPSQDIEPGLQILFPPSIAVLFGQYISLSELPQILLSFRVLPEAGLNQIP